ncbi:hypothetical protein SPAN111604_05620 [Sphingomonas antarctica]|uniref:hypothetical protein n=1 Tax=Sphingomonas antarctica TaxID=2040274 RepID=UPI0039E99D82
MKTLVLLPLALLSTAAMAQDYPPPPQPYGQAREQQYQDSRDARYDDRQDAREYAPRSPIDPSTARQVMGAVEAVTDAMLDVRIDGIRRAADPSARDNGDRTIGDLMARRDPAYREHIRQDMTRAAGAAVRAGRTATAVQAAANDFARKIEHALNESGY